MKLLERTTKKESEQKEDYLVKNPDIFGFSRGKLMVYRDRFRKDGVIKGPGLLMKQMESNDMIKREYMEFLQS